MNSGLRDQGVLITGAAGGIGQATARAFAVEGAKLALHYHRNREGVDRLLAEFRGAAVAVQADLRDEGQTEAMFAEALGVLPRIDAVIVNAGIWNATPTPLHEMDFDQWRHTLDSNLTSAFLTCRAFLRHLETVRRETASIVLVASTAALFGEADHADYSASKAAMAYGLTRSLKNEIVKLAPRGRVNCVCPGWTDTPMAADQLADPELVRIATATRPLHTIARAEDIASAIVFLCSDSLAGHITGAILPIAGGMEGRLLHP